MHMFSKKRQVLEILVKNLDNPQPKVVPSEMIANKLDMSVKEACQLLKIMNGMGVIVSDAEGHNALITREGVNCVNHNYESFY